jgi:hypothetical protein
VVYKLHLIEPAILDAKRSASLRISQARDQSHTERRTGDGETNYPANAPCATNRGRQALLAVFGPFLSIPYEEYLRCSMLDTMDGNCVGKYTLLLYLLFRSSTHCQRISHRLTSPYHPSTMNDASDDPSVKRQEDSPATTGLNLDVLTMLLSFSGPRELLHLSQTCRRLRNAVSTTLVVKSALIAGGNARKAMEALLPLMNDQSIYVPSAQRLLLLANRKYCEFCRKRNASYGLSDFGLSLCGRCYPKHSTHMQRGHGPKIAAVLFHRRVAGLVKSLRAKRILKRRPTTHPEDKIGPIVSFEDIRFIAKHSKGFDDYLRTKLNAPASEKYAEFLGAYHGCFERAQKVKKENAQRKNRERLRRKKTAVALINRLSALLEEPWRHTALMRTPIRFSARLTMEGWFPFQFAFSFVHDLLEPYMLVPDKMDEDTLHRISAEINKGFALIRDRFSRLDFLSDHDPFESKLKSCVSRDFSSFESLLSIGDVSSYWLRILDCNPFQALVDLYGGDFGRGGGGGTPLDVVERSSPSSVSGCGRSVQ